MNRVLRTLATLLMLWPICAATGAELPVKKACKLSPIVRPTVQSKIIMRPGLETEFQLQRRVSMALKSAPDGKRYIQFEEAGELALGPDSLNMLMNPIVSGLRGQETCQFSISNLTGVVSWAKPPNFKVDGDGKGRKCTSFSLPCGQPTIHCDYQWGIPYNCYPQQPMCLTTQATDLANWSVSLSGTLPIKLGADKNSFDVQVVHGDPVQDTGGSGEVARILESIGLLKILENVDNQLQVNLNFNSIPSTGQLVSLVAPTDAVTSTLLRDVSWTDVRDTDAGRYASVGIAYHQSFSRKLETGCLIAVCLRSSKNDEEFGRCVLKPQ